LHNEITLLKGGGLVAGGGHLPSADEDANKKGRKRVFLPIFLGRGKGGRRNNSPTTFSRPGEVKARSIACLWEREKEALGGGGAETALLLVIQRPVDRGSFGILESFSAKRERRKGGSFFCMNTRGGRPLFSSE